jgi:hypothetical protein
MLLDSLANPRGAFVMWTRNGHAIQQENKSAVLDLLDALAYPSEEYLGYTPGPSGGESRPSTVVTPAETAADRMRLAIEVNIYIHIYIYIYVYMYVRMYVYT